MPLPSTSVAVLINVDVVRSGCGNRCAFLLAGIELPNELALQHERAIAHHAVVVVLVCGLLEDPTATAEEVAVMASPPAKMVLSLRRSTEPELAAAIDAALCEFALAWRTPSS